MIRHGGFTLVEALAALLVTAVALAGIAALLVQAIRHERDAANRATALRLAAGLSEQLRALPRPDGRPLASIAGGDSGPDCTASPTACPAELAAAAALTSWLAEVARQLPLGASGRVETVGDRPPGYLISIDWASPGGERSTLRLRVET